MTQFPYINIDEFIRATTGQGINRILELLTYATLLKARLPSVGKHILLSRESGRQTIDKMLDYLGTREYINCGRYAICDSPADNCIKTFVDIHLLASNITVDIVGDPTEVTILMKYFKDTFSTIGTKIYTADRLDKRGDVQTTVNYINDSSMQLAHDSFYPWINIPLVDYFKAFMESNESVLVLFGSPGTGKSTFLRSLIVSGNFQSMLAYNTEVIESPSLLKEFFSIYTTRILAYEDIDKYLGTRESGNNLMSSILNASEGVIQYPNKKIVFSTNLETIDKIDPALLRVGRCFDILKFELLTAEQGSAVLADLGRESKDFSSKKSWSLAEVLSPKHTAKQSINRFGRRTGFVSN